MKKLTRLPSLKTRETPISPLTAIGAQCASAATCFYTKCNSDLRHGGRYKHD